jgi:hypothetical protein
LRLELLSLSQIACNLPFFLCTSLIHKRIVMNKNSFHSCSVSFLSTLAQRLFSQLSQENDLRRLHFDVELRFEFEFSCFTCTSSKICYKLPNSTKLMLSRWMKWNLLHRRPSLSIVFFSESRPMKRSHAFDSRILK